MRRIRSLGAATFLLAMAILVPDTAIAADPLLPTPGAWLMISKAGGYPFYTGGDTAPGLETTWPTSAITEFQFSLVKIGNGPGESLTSLTVQRPRGQFDHPFGIAMGTSVGPVIVTLRKPAANGQADWYTARMTDPKVSYDEVRTSKGATTSTEILTFTFTKLQVQHRVQNAQGYGSYTEVPPQFDIKDTVALAPVATSPLGGRLGNAGALQR